MNRCLLIIMIALCGSKTTGQIRFSERGMDLNIQHELQQWTIGTGVSLYDFNQDGLDDITLGTEAGRPLAFFINVNGSFNQIDPLVGHQENAKQILWCDYDNDGDPDLFVATFDGVSRLYNNSGDLNLVDVTESAGLLIETRRSYGAAWGDINRDGWLDLYVSARDIPGTPDYKNLCRLYISNADGTFTESGNAYGADDVDKIPFSSSFLDYNNDMWPDIYTAHDRYVGNTLLRNDRGLAFDDVSAKTRTDLSINGMCVNFADINRDGWLDIYVTNTEEGNKMLLNDPLDKSTDETVFTEVSAAMGIAFNGIGWGSNFLDADNDGDHDLYVSGQQEGAKVVSSLFYEQEPFGSYRIIRSGDFLKDTVPSFANAIGDWNNDGLIDILVQNNPPYPFHLWENHSTTQDHWIKFSLKGQLSNREAIGTRLDIYSDDLHQMAYTHSGFGFLGQNSRNVHFGLSQHDLIDSLVISWPSGHTDRFYNMETDRSYAFFEGQSTGGEVFVAEDVNIVNRTISTSISELTDQKTLNIFPNPAASQITVHSRLPMNRIIIFDALGRQIFSTNNIEEKRSTLEISTLPKGIFTVVAYTDHGNFLSQFIKT